MLMMFGVVQKLFVTCRGKLGLMVKPEKNVYLLFRWSSIFDKLFTWSFALSDSISLARKYHAWSTFFSRSYSDLEFPITF